jgi:hypothetical protein
MRGVPLSMMGARGFDNVALLLRFIVMTVGRFLGRVFSFSRGFIVLLWYALFLLHVQFFHFLFYRLPMYTPSVLVVPECLEIVSCMSTH